MSAERFVTRDDILRADDAGALEVAKDFVQAMRAVHPPNDVPADMPQSFLAGLRHKGPCAIACWSADRWVYHPMLDGISMADGRTGKLVMCDSYAQAMDGLSKVIAARGRSL